MLCLLVACGTSNDDPTFVAWGSSTTSINLLWQPVDGATGYTLERVGGETITLDDTGYLDLALAPGAYTYRLTALGTDLVQTTATETSDDVALVTEDEPPIGEPVTGQPGAAGGTLELAVAKVTIPPGAFPDGVAVTLQEIVAPTGDGDIAIELTGDDVPTQPIEIAIAVGEDAANVGIAERQPDGMWIAVEHRVEGDRAIVATSKAAGRRASKAYRAKYVRFRRYRIEPQFIDVRAGTQHTVRAQAVHSDDMCQINEILWTCVPSVPRPIVEYHDVPNQDGGWYLEGPGRLEGDRHALAMTYTAPSERPAQRHWPIKFLPNKPYADAVSARVTFLGNQYRMKFVYRDPETTIGYGLAGDVRDEFLIVIDIGGEGMPVRVDGRPLNQPSEILSSHALAPAVSATKTSSFEHFTARSASFSYANHSMTALVEGFTEQAATTTVDVHGTSHDLPGQIFGYTMGLVLDGIDFSRITETQTFDAPPTLWKVEVTPVAERI